MSAVPVPSRFERLLQAAVSDAELREDVVGDLAQEFVQRVATRGSLAAHRWYRQEALRTLPPLLAHSARRLRRKDLRAVADALITATVAMVGLCLAVGLAVSAWKRSATISPSFIDLILTSPLDAGAMLVCLLSTGGPLFGGYVAARSCDRAPLVTGAVCGAVWSLLFIAIAATPATPDLPMWLDVCGPGMIIAGSVLGSVARVEAGGVLRGGCVAANGPVHP